MTRGVAEVDLSAIAANLDVVAERAGDAQVMAVVKADAYGHGMLPVSRAARAHGVPWLGVALPAEALALRADGDAGRVLAWLWTPGDPDVDACVAQGIDLSVSTTWALAEVAAAARRHGTSARVHVKVDTGLSRNGAGPAEWPDVLAAVAQAGAEGAVDVVALWTHFADADTPGAGSVAAQRTRFADAVAEAAAAGLRPDLQHLSNSGGLWAHPDLRAGLVRIGIAMYGLTPAPALGTGADLGLVPAMTLRSALANTKAVEPGTGVSYGHTWSTRAATTLGLVPLGYADGIPRAGSDRVEVAVAGQRHRCVGRVAMDQFVVDLGRDAAEAGTPVVLFGPGYSGEPTADDWAHAMGTIGYEIVTRIGPRVPRAYVGGAA
ncbi:MAG: alanine racemase [Actinomycetota bacterium]|nr:alanine racemase [Actinomycetota bacterium]